jgi:hypothetical protein
VSEGGAVFEPVCGAVAADLNVVGHGVWVEVLKGGEVVTGLRFRDAEFAHEVMAVDETVDVEHFRDPFMALAFKPIRHLLWYPLL